MNIAAFIAWRYLRFKHKDKNISFMIKVCFLGIFVGTFALMLTLIITNGFEKVIHEKMQGINAQIIVSSPGNRLQYTELRRSILDSYGHVLKGVSGYTLKQAILNHQDLQNVMVLKGVDSYHESDVTTIMQKIVGKPKMSFNDLLAENGIIIGYKTAQLYNLELGDEVTLMIPEPGGKKKILLNKKQFVVNGIFNVGLEEYDSNFAFISLDLMHDLYDEDGVDYVTMTTKSVDFSLVGMMRSLRNFGSHDFAEQELITSLHHQFPHLKVQSWKDLYPALVSSLKLEKYVMFLIIVLISLVASMNMISLLFMQIQQKQRDIAILKAMGLASSTIRNVFLYLGLSVTLCASVMGLGCAALVGYFLERYPCIQLPDVYYVSHLPARMDLEIFIVVFVVTMLIGFLATWYPAQRSKFIVVADVLRQ